MKNWLRKQAERGIRFIQWLFKWTIIVSVIAVVVWVGITYFSGSKQVYVQSSEPSCSTNKELSEICNDRKFKSVELLRARKIKADRQVKEGNEELKKIRDEEMKLGIVGSL